MAKKKKKNLSNEEKQKLPYIPLYTGDYIKDTRDLSLEAKGAWSDMILFMWSTKSKGVLVGSIDDFSRRIGSTSAEQTARIITELTLKNVADVAKDNEGLIFTVSCRRLVRESRISAVRTNAVQNRYKPGTKDVQSSYKEPAKSVQKPDNEYEIDNEVVSDVAVDPESHGKSENYFHGPVPSDLREYADKLEPSSLKSEAWQRQVRDEINAMGYECHIEVKCYYPDQDSVQVEGFIDLRARKEDVICCIELDNRVVTRDSLVKIQHYEKQLPVGHGWKYSGMVLLRDPKPKESGKYNFDIPLSPKKLTTTSTQEVTREEIEEEIFNDFKLMDSFKKENPKIDIKKLWINCWKWHIVKPSPPVHAWEWKQKLMTFFNNENVNQRQTQQIKSSIDDIELPSYE
jgi:hypothetical protein